MTRHCEPQSGEAISGTAMGIASLGRASASQHLHLPHTCPGGRCQGVQV